MKAKYNRGKQRKGMDFFNTRGDVIQAALKWQKARDESGIKGMLSQLETEEALAEVIQAYLKDNKS